MRARIASVIREARSGRYCFYDQARDRFAWMSERGEDVLLPIIQILQVEGLLMLGAAGGFINIFAVPASAALLKAFRAGDFMRAQEIQRRLNRCFPRGGEEALGHLGVTKVTASVATGIDMGPARPPYMAPEDAAERLRKRLPQLQEIL